MYRMNIIIINGVRNAEGDNKFGSGSAMYYDDL